ncbi:MAG TPA: cation:proton antiporter [Nitrososphaerales archaeon]|nr:cation:proton antiporter [Nitrososphaerales archaeon]
MSLIPTISEALLSLLYLGVLLIFSKLGEEAFRKVGLIPFVGSILVGIIVGPGFLNAIQVIPTISVFISIGINFLLFVSGAEEFEASRVRSMLGKRNLVLSIFQFTIRFSAITLVAFLLFHQIIPALIIGIVAGMASAGPLTRLLTDTGLSRTEEGTAIFSEVLVIEIAAVIVFSFVFDLANKPFTIASIALISLELTAAIVGIVLFGRYVMIPLLGFVENHFNSREAVFAILIGVLLITGFIAQLTGFNSALVALFLGLLLQKFFANRPALMSKLHAFTYGFFEPLFFIGLGLYFVQLTPSLLIFGVAIFAASLFIDSSIGAISARIFGVSPWKNAFGTCVNGGVDATLLVTALTASTALISGFTYSATAIGIALLSLTAPLLFRFRAPVVRVDQEEGEKEIVRQQLNQLTAKEICTALPTVTITQDQTVQTALRRILDLDARAIVVINDQRKPIGTILLRNAMSLSDRQLRTLKVTDVLWDEAVIVGENEPALNLAALFKEKNIPMIAVVDAQGALEGTIMEKEILRRIVTSVEPTKEPVQEKENADHR